MAFLRRFRKKRRSQPRVAIIELGYGPTGPTTRLLYGELRPAAATPIEEKADDGTVNAAPLIRRLLAIADALQDIPRQALRLAYWQARPKEERRPERWSPLRPGRPPGFRQRSKHELDEILKECHWLARDGVPELDDTS
jgi:hypothetical protein